MNRIFIIAIVYLVGIGVLLIFNEINYRWFRLKGEYTRKFAHVAATLSTLPFPYLFPSHWYVLVLALIFFFVLYFTQRSTYLESIHDISRKSVGSYLLPLSIYITFLISEWLDQKILYLLPMLILALCDPAAALIGMNVKKGNRRIKIGHLELKKTWYGSLGFFVTGFLITIVAFYFHYGTLNGYLIFVAVMVGLGGSVAELVSLRGSDNLTIPLVVLAVLLILL